MSHAGRKNGVLLCAVGPEFRPDRPWETPPIVRGATLYAEGLADGTWCVPIRRGHLYTSPDAPQLRANGNGHACPALAISRDMVKAAIAAALAPSPAAGDGRCGSRVEGPESDVQSPLPFPSAPSAVDLLASLLIGWADSGLTCCGLPRPAFSPPALCRFFAAAADVDELAMVLDHDLEVTHAKLLMEDCR